MTVEVGQKGSSSLRLEPAGEQIVGVDIIITYNPALLKLLDVKKGELFGQTVATIIDNEKGQAKLAFSNNYGVKTRKTGTVATLVWERLRGVGTPVVKLEFTPGETKDTNVVIAGGRDVLGSVGGLTVTVNNKQVEDRKQMTNEEKVLGVEEQAGIAVGNLQMPSAKPPGVQALVVGLGLLVVGGGWWMVESKKLS